MQTRDRLVEYERQASSAENWIIRCDAPVQVNLAEVGRWTMRRAYFRAAGISYPP